MPVTQFLELKDQLAGIEAVNGSPCIWEFRMIKTEGGNRPHPPYLRTGERCLRRGAEPRLDRRQRARGGAQTQDRARPPRRELRPYLPAIAGQGGSRQIVCGPHDRIIEKGDIVFFDTGSTFDGYFCDFDRNYAAGRVSAEARRAHEAMWLATEAGIRAAVVGGGRTRCSQAWQGSSPQPARSATMSAGSVTVSACSLPNRRPTCRATERCSRPTW